MTKKFALIIAVLSAFASSSLMANPQVKMGTFNAGSSGNYRADPNAELDWVLSNYVAGKSTDGTWFGTFCVQKNEYFTSGSTYDVVLNDRAIAGGVTSPTVGYDIISVGTAFLYSKFATGSLSTYNNSAFAADLQNVFWYLEGEQTSYGADSNITYITGLLTTQFGSIAAAKADYTGSAVKVMNLTSNKGRTLNQDQLVYVGVPDGGITAILLGLGLLGIAFATRRTR